MSDPDNSLQREFNRWKAAESDRGIVSSTTFEDWLEMRKNK